jgi:hypothetical protein
MSVFIEARAEVPLNFITRIMKAGIVSTQNQVHLEAC